MTATKGLGTYGNAVGVVTPLDHKMAQLGLIVKTAANTIRPGLFWDGNTTVVSGTANMSYNVRAFSAVTSRGATAGAVLLTNDGTYNVATTAAPGSNSRYDVMYVWPREYSLDGTDSNPVIGVVQGTAAAVPSVPSLAAFPGAIELARILVPAGVTATNSGTTITQTAPFTSTDGSPVPFRTTTEMNAWTTALTNQRAVDLSTGVNYRWGGAAWKAWESDWISYTPALTGFVLGSGGVNSCRYRYVESEIEVDVTFTFGSSGQTFPTNPAFALPTNAATLKHQNMAYLGTGTGYDTSAGSTVYLSMHADGTSVSRARWFVLGTGGLSGISTTSPWTWATGDVLAGRLVYTPA